MRPVIDGAVQEGLALDPLAHQPALHVGERHDERVDLPVADHPLELLEAGMLGMAVVAHGPSDPWAGKNRRRPWWAASYGPGWAVRTYLAVIPPSATTTEPVTNDDSSEARKSATLAISRGSPGRPMGWNESISS